ncbi:MAG: lipoyl(octanoyl) transferase LipB [Candidatus Omnitrophica bacterium]|nr:lipoyl(octanoyl) transferase LipB [Candidatus Omnitrophota bacterium]
MENKNKIQCIDLGLIEYRKAYELQKCYVQDAITRGQNFLLICEHPAVLTLGRLTNPKHILVSQKLLEEKGIPMIAIDRGGDVTLHAPGQLVIYPILCLQYFGKDLKKYLWQLEQVAIDLLGDFDIVANRLEGKTGVWAQEKKIASIGIGVRKWVTFHGIGININTDLDLFSLIKPCGLDVSMTSLSRIKNKSIKMQDVKIKLLDVFQAVFNVSQGI